MTSPRYLTKSRFKLACECPAKLYYTGKKEKYKDNKLDDPFLEALAEGGFQVGELAKLYHPGGFNIDYRDSEKALRHTNELLERDQVIIYEAAFRYENLFIRADVIVKDGNSVELIEVKAKLYDAEKDADFLGSRGYIASAWAPYLYDVAFQKYVLTHARPEFHVRSFLMLANKQACASVDGLNQKFMLVQDERDRTGVKLNGPCDPESLGDKILVKVSSDHAAEMIYEGTDMNNPPDMSFVDRVRLFSDMYARDEKILTKPGAFCKGCEFNASREDEMMGILSGFKECWKEAFALDDADFDKPMILDIWNFRRKDVLLENEKLFISDVTENDMNVSSSDGTGLSSSERQWLQVEKIQKKDPSPYLDRAGFERAMESWKYPLHFIDFETSMVAIPFNSSRRPYEVIAFQFSHHTVQEDGTIAHAGEYINRSQGMFPNYDFLRHLKKELENDNGTIFRYAAHENTVLNQIHVQLEAETVDQVPDRDELMAFIESITTKKNGSKIVWDSPRTMIDMLRLVLDYYYSPMMGGSNSIKKVLPAVLNESEFLKQKYSVPIYGSAGGIPSLNYRDKVWIEFNGSQVKDPYKTLPPVFDGIDDELLDRFVTDENIADGGAAMMAYARMQFSEMSDLEREKIISALLRYCELDTFAMVMIYEHWFNECNGK